MKGSAISIYWPNIFLLWSPWGKRLRRIRKGSIKAVYDYMKLNESNFNLLECSKALGIPEEDIITVFISFLRKEIIDVINPMV